MSKRKSKALPKSLTKITPFSRTLAIIIIVIFVLVGVFAGVIYQARYDRQANFYGSQSK